MPDFNQSNPPKSVTDPKDQGTGDAYPKHLHLQKPRKVLADGSLAPAKYKVANNPEEEADILKNKNYGVKPFFTPPPESEKDEDDDEDDVDPSTKGAGYPDFAGRSAKGKK